MHNCRNILALFEKNSNKILNQLILHIKRTHFFAPVLHCYQSDNSKFQFHFIITFHKKKKYELEPIRLVGIGAPVFPGTTAVKSHKTNKTGVFAENCGPTKLVGPG